jgi:hypothetical protein
MPATMSKFLNSSNSTDVSPAERLALGAIYSGASQFAINMSDSGEGTMVQGMVGRGVPGLSYEEQQYNKGVLLAQGIANGNINPTALLMMHVLGGQSHASVGGRTFVHGPDGQIVSHSMPSPPCGTGSCHRSDLSHIARTGTKTVTAPKSKAPVDAKKIEKYFAKMMDAMRMNKPMSPIANEMTADGFTDVEIARVMDDVKRVFKNIMKARKAKAKKAPATPATPATPSTPTPPPPSTPTPPPHSTPTPPSAPTKNDAVDAVRDACAVEVAEARAVAEHAKMEMEMLRLENEKLRLSLENEKLRSSLELAEAKNSRAPRLSRSNGKLDVSDSDGDVSASGSEY